LSVLYSILVTTTLHSCFSDLHISSVVYGVIISC